MFTSEKLIMNSVINWTKHYSCKKKKRVRL